MRRTIFLTSLTMALAVPLFAGCGNNSTGSMVVVPPGGITLPNCDDGQLIAVDGQRNMNCTQALTAGLAPPDCGAGQNLVLNAYDGKLECMPKATGGSNTTLTNVINKVVSDTNTIEQTINSFKAGGSAAKYCGRTTASTTGAISGGGATGALGAAKLCEQAPGCGAGAHMCTVYEMYESVASGSITAAMTIGQSWVHMSSWQHNGGTSINNGLNDNCGGWTYPTQHLGWFGTTVEWKNAAVTNQRALHFASGNTDPGGGPSTRPVCGNSFPIACCL